MKNSIDPEIVGSRIRDIRKTMGLSMSAFAERINHILNEKKIRSGTVSNWETGKNLPNNERLKAIAEIGGISVNELLYGDMKNFISSYFDERISENQEKAKGSFYGSMLNDSEYIKSVKKDFLYKVQFYELNHADTEALNKLIDESIYAVMRGEEYTNEGAFALAKNRLHDTVQQLEEFFHEVVREDGKNRITPNIKNGLDPVILENLKLIFNHAENEVSAAKKSYLDNNQ